MGVIAYGKTLDRKLADLRAAADIHTENEHRLASAGAALAIAEEAQSTIQKVAQSVQQEAHDRIAGLVSRCLEAIFDEPYEFKIDFERKRGKTEAELKFVRGGLTLDDPMNQAGGGVIDVASFALRLACLVLQRPPLRRLLVLDEPFKNIRGADYRSRVRSLLEALATEVEVQFLLCVDADAYPQFVLGHVVEMGK